MDEYSALAQRVVLTMDDVRGCLVLSRDGLVLGAFPEEREPTLKPAWLRFVNVGEARRGFVEFGDQIWAYVHRGPYAAFVVAGHGVRPGVLLDQLEQAVLAAEEARAEAGHAQGPRRRRAPPRASRGPRCTRRRTDRPPSRRGRRRSRRGAPRGDVSRRRGRGRRRWRAGRGPWPESSPVRAGDRPAPFGGGRAPSREVAEPVDGRGGETADAGAAEPPADARRRRRSPTGDRPASSFPREPQKLVGDARRRPAESPARSTASCWPKSSGDCFRWTRT